jgi:hypothetical protein
MVGCEGASILGVQALSLVLLHPQQLQQKHPALHNVPSWPMLYKPTSCASEAPSLLNCAMHAAGDVR